MKRRTIVITLLIVVVCGAVGIIVLSQTTNSKKYSGPPAQVSIGTASFNESGLIWIAEERRYFSENGLNVTIKLFEAGKYAVRALLDGDVDVATVADFVFAGNAMNQEKIQTIGNISKSDFHYLIARKDRGITQVSDLKAKKIGLTRQTSAEFYLGRYLQLKDMSLDDVILVDLKPSMVGESLAKGDVDAVISWDPYAYFIEKGLGRNAVIWSAQSGQMMHWLLVCRNDFIAANPEIIDRLLCSFDQAEKFMVNNQEKSKKILQKRLNLEEAYVERIWPKTRLGLSLGQGLIIAMEDQSRWMIDNDLTDNPKMPYYPDYIQWQGLEKLKPESVTLVR